MGKDRSTQKKRFLLPPVTFAYAATLAAVFASYILFFLFDLAPQRRDVQTVCIFALLILGVVAFNQYRRNELDYRRVILLIFGASLIIRLAYCVYTPIDVRQHDVYSVGDMGHLDYILHFVDSWKLPDTYRNQFYHPPLHHILGALWVKFNTGLGMDLDTAVDALSFLPLLYTSFSLIAAYRILRLMGLSKKATVISYSLVALHPTFTIFSASVNNDPLCLFFTLLAFQKALEWYKNPSLKRIVALAVILALGALTKLSVLLLAVPIGFLFLARLFLKDGGPGTGKLWGQYALFGVISIPLSLSHSIRNFIVLNQPLGYVPNLGESSWLYTGNHSIVDRFIKPFSSQFFTNAYCSVGEDYNIPEYILRSSLFGEYFFKNADWLASTLTVLNMFLILFSLAAMVYVIIHAIRSGPRPQFLACGLLWVALMVSYITFNLQYPHACTMDFRYLVPTVLTGAVFLGKADDLLAVGKEALWKELRPLYGGLVVLFGLSSAWFYLWLT